MAAVRKKTKPSKGQGDKVDYADFIGGLLTGTLTATAMTETVAADGNRATNARVFVSDPNGPENEFDANGNVIGKGRYVNATVTERLKKLVKLEYDEP